MPGGVAVLALAAWLAACTGGSQETKGDLPVRATSTTAPATTTATASDFADLTAGQVALLEEAAHYSAAHGGLSMLVRYRNEVLFERYDHSVAGDAHLLYSGTKSFTCALAVAAADDGLLTLDEAVADTLPGWRNDPDLAGITIHQLLSLSSGIEAGQQADIVSYQDAAARARMRTPGEHSFDYGPDPFQIFGAVMEAKLAPDDDILGYLERRVFAPIGLTYAQWRDEPAGQPRLSAGAFLTAESWSRYGQLMVDGGRWEDREVLDPEEVEVCFSSGEGNPGYGMAFWLPTVDGGLGSGGFPSDRAQRLTAVGVPADFAKAAGVGGQGLYLFPSLDLVVVRQTGGPADPATEGFDDVTFLAPVMEALGAAGELRDAAPP